jgi:hypothetical protein
LLITAIGCGYVVSRGIAKAGTRDPNIDGGSDADFADDCDTSYYGRD